MQKAGMSIKEQLQYLKGLTVRTSVIHEAQALQVRNYPLFIPGVKPKATTKIDTENQIVYYECEPRGKRFNKRVTFNQRCEMITKWVRSVLWDRTTVVVSVSGEVRFDSRTHKFTVLDDSSSESK